MRIFSQWMALALLFGLANPGRAAEAERLPFEEARMEAIERALPSAVSVIVPGGAGGGSAVMLTADGYAFTNYHVVSPAGSAMRCSLADGTLYDAVVVGIDPVGDLAMIKLVGRDDFPAATLGDSNDVQPGDWSIVIGNPMLLATNLKPSVSWGIISGTHRYQYPSGTLLEYGDCLQTDAAVNPGNSGGPLYNGEGELIGIIGRCSFEKRGRINVGVGYAISINQAKNFRWMLAGGRIVDHGTLGFTVSTSDAGEARVSNISRSSDAYRRGIQYGDTILSLAEREVRDANDVKNVIATLPPLWKVPVTYVHDGERRSTKIRLESVHRQDDLLAKMEGGILGGSPHGEEQDRAEEVPESIAPLLQKRRGYANYYFNRLHRVRVVSMIRDSFAPEVTSADSGLALRGTIEDKSFSWQISDAGVQFQEGETQQKDDFFEAIRQRDVAAIAAPLAALQKILQAETEQFGELYYWGRVPYDVFEPTHDMLVGTLSDIAVRFIVDPTTSRLASIECIADDDADPAELHMSYSDAGQINGLRLVFGEEEKLVCEIKSLGPRAE